jgi:hypothetical protein
LVVLIVVLLLESLFIVLASLLEVFELTTAGIRVGSGIDGLFVLLTGRLDVRRLLGWRRGSIWSGGRSGRRGGIVMVVDLLVTVVHGAGDDSGADRTDGETASSTHHGTLHVALVLGRLTVAAIPALTTVAAIPALTTVAIVTTVSTVGVMSVLSAVATISARGAAVAAISGSGTAIPRVAVASVVTVAARLGAVRGMARHGRWGRMATAGGLPLAAARGLLYVVPALIVSIPLGGPSVRQGRLVGGRSVVRLLAVLGTAVGVRGRGRAVLVRRRRVVVTTWGRRRVVVGGRRRGVVVAWRRRSLAVAVAARAAGWRRATVPAGALIARARRVALVVALSRRLLVVRLLLVLLLLVLVLVLVLVLLVTPEPKALKLLGDLLEEGHAPRGQVVEMSKGRV